MTQNLLDAAEPTVAPAAAEDAIPEKFRDPETGALLAEKLLKSYLALERRAARMISLPAGDASDDERLQFHRALGVPETPEAYPIAPKHPALKPDAEVNRRLHAAGFTPGQAQVVYDLACEYVLPQLETMAAELRGGQDREKLIRHFGGEQRFRETARALEAWGRGRLPAPVFEALAASFDGVLALETMMRSQEPGLGGSGGPADAMLDEAGLVQLMQDPRYWKKRDPAVLARVQDGFRRLYPD